MWFVHLFDPYTQMSCHILADLYDDFPRKGEIVYQYDPNKTFYENISVYFPFDKGEFKKVKEVTISESFARSLPKSVTEHPQEVFTISREHGREATFYLQKYRDGFSFGWKEEMCLQQRSWQYIVRDILMVFSYHLFV